MTPLDSLLAALSVLVVFIIREPLDNRLKDEMLSFTYSILFVWNLIYALGII